MRKECILFGHSIYAEITRLDSGWDVGVFGGCSTHVGAVAIAESDSNIQTLERCGHKEIGIASKWAVKLAEVLGETVCVRCGIHYDNLTKTQLEEIMIVCDELLQGIIQSLKEEL